MATLQELTVLEQVLTGKEVSVEELEGVKDQSFVWQVLNYYLSRDFLLFAPYLKSQLLADTVDDVLINRYEDKLPETYGFNAAIRALDADQKIALLRVFPKDFTRLYAGLDRDFVLDYLRKVVQTDEGAESIKPNLQMITYRFGNDAEFVEWMFEYTQELSWICFNEEDALKFGYVFEADEQVKNTFDSASWDRVSDLALLVFTSSKIIPRWLVRDAFEDSSIERFNVYRKALESNPAAADIVEELNAAAAAAKPFPGRPDIHKVEKLKELRVLARKKGSHNHGELANLELDALAYEHPYNLKLKALDRAKAQEASGELTDPFKVVELENLIQRVETFMVMRAVNEYLFEQPVPEFP